MMNQMDQMHRGLERHRSGDLKGAFDDYVACWEQNCERGAAFYAVRLSFLIGYIADLAIEYHPAMEKLKEWARQLRLEVTQPATSDRASVELQAVSRELKRVIKGADGDP